jgi:hypothetical protein
MAVVVTCVDRAVPGAAYECLNEITFSSNNDYVTNGIAITAAMLGMQRVDWVIPIQIGPSLASGIAGISWDRANQKVKFYTDAGVEVGNGVDISSVKLYVLAKGV